MEERDLIIIGGGPAGLTAGIYSVRAELKTAIIDSAVPGGKIGSASLIENYPGFPDGIQGMVLAERMREHAKKVGVEMRNFERVLKIQKDDIAKLVRKSHALPQGRRHTRQPPIGSLANAMFTTTTDKNAYRSKAVIIATGLTNKKLGIPGELEYSGKGVSYCATCDGPLFKNKSIAVIGGGTAAAMAALYLSGIARKVTIVTKSAQLSAAEEIIKTRLRKSRVKVIFEAQMKEIVGDMAASGIKVLKNKKEQLIEADGIFVEAGKMPNTEVLSGLNVKLKNGYVVVDENQMTSVQGMYAAGDVTAGKIKQLSVAVAHGAVAALNAYKYIKKM